MLATSTTTNPSKGRQHTVPNKDYTALMFIMDRSGSMRDIKQSVETGMRGIISDLAKQPGKVTVDLVDFDTEITHSSKLVPLSNFRFVLEPRGGTALYDAIVTGASEMRKQIEKMTEDARPAHVQIVVVTDGHENSSKVADAVLVKDTVEWSTDNLGYDFTFLGANQDAVVTGAALGFEGKKSMTFNSTASGVAGTSSSLADYINQTRRGEDASYSDSHRSAARR